MEKSRSQKKRVSIAGMHIDRASAVPIYLQIAAHLRNGILQGSLPAGTQFLGSREIARELGCSRTVVLTAWDLLYAEGYLESTPRGGVTVASVKQAQANPVPAALTAAGARLTPVSVDDKGLYVSEGIRLAPNAKLVVVTPSHQYPIGVSMGLERRFELLDWANRNDAWIIEDDYNSEFRHQDSMIASLRSLDRDGRVIYLGT